MANLDSLEITSISKMSYTKSIDLILAIRRSRMTPTAKSRKTAKKIRKTSPLNLVNNLTPEQADKILQMIEAKETKE